MSFILNFSRFEVNVLEFMKTSQFVEPIIIFKLYKKYIKALVNNNFGLLMKHESNLKIRTSLVKILFFQADRKTYILMNVKKMS